MIRYVKKSDANISDFLFIKDICVNGGLAKKVHSYLRIWLVY